MNNTCPECGHDHAFDMSCFEAGRLFERHLSDTGALEACSVCLTRPTCTSYAQGKRVSRTDSTCSGFYNRNFY